MAECAHVNQRWLINPRSGNGAGARLLEALRDLPGVLATPIEFADLDSQIGDITPTATVVVAGGDGTFSSVLGSKALAPRKVACIPLGTANDLAREVGISSLIRGRNPRDLPELIAGLQAAPFAIWNASVDGHEYPCANYISVGYEGAVVADFTAWRSRTKWSGKVTNRLAYTVCGLRHSLHKIRGLSVASDGGSAVPCAPTTGLIVTNIKSHLGLGIANSRSSPHDGRIECVSVPHVVGFLQMIGASLRILPAPRVFAQGNRLTISGIPDGTSMQIDGEERPPVTSGSLDITFRHFVPLMVGSNRNAQ